MTTTTAMPDAKGVRDMLADMFGRDVDVAPGVPPLAADLIRAMVAVYSDDHYHLAAVLGMDLHLAAYAAAAIGLVPAGAAEDCVADRELSQTLRENGFEVCNVVGALLNRDGHPHVRMDKVVYPGETPPNDAAGRLLALGNRLDLTVKVHGYGAGRFWLSAI
jgi:hypothetical protein